MVVVGSMMADITDEDEFEFGRQREGIFFGAPSFATKAASGLGIVIAGAACDFIGLHQGLDPADGGPRSLGCSVSSRVGSFWDCSASPSCSSGATT
jgi:hypothetical protein